MTTSLRTSLRNQMLEVHFDATQGCFLGQPVGSESIFTFAPQGLTSHLERKKTFVVPEIPFANRVKKGNTPALPFTQETWRQLEYTNVLTGTSF